jgi:DNA-binding MarR family transcriptional regulator
MNRPTPKQVQALYHLECFTGVYGRVPTFRELAALLGVRLSAAQRRLFYAEKKGLVQGRTLTDAGRAAVALGVDR